MTWSTWSSTSGVFAGDAPHILQMQLSRIKIAARKRQFIFLDVFRDDGRVASLSDNSGVPDSLSALPLIYLINPSRALFQLPNLFS